MKKITMENYLKTDRKKLHIVKIATDWCGYCKMMKGVVEPSLIKENEEKFYYIDADADELWESKNQGDFKLEVVPTYYLVKENKILDFKKAFVPLDEFNAWIKKNK